ncbi:hypothetical protein OH764_28900 [Burkholderia sp. M6-3]|jgi:hypothetical protein
MSKPLNLDLRARAELLTYLVVSHLLARQMTGEWLSVEHLVESTTLWLKTNGGGADVMQRVMLSTRALDVARGLEQTLGPAVAPASVTALFCGVDSFRKRCPDQFAGLQDACAFVN